MTDQGGNRHAPEITIFNLNLRFGLANDGGNSWRYRRSHFPELLSRWSADLYTFQEVNAFQAQALDNMLGDHRRIGQRDPAPDHWQNNLIYAHRRWRCLKADHFYLSDTPDTPSRYHDSRWPRQCTIGLYRSGQCELVCLNTHLDFTAAVQTRSARLMMRRLNENFPTHAATLLAGDFNTGPGSPCRRVFTQPETDPLSQTDVNQAFKDAFLSEKGGTHHGFTGKGRGEAIDWILYRGPLELVESLIVTDVFEGRYPSDHFPLWARFAGGM